MAEMRFASEELKPMFRPPVRHFTPVDSDKDRFGNRLFPSGKHSLFRLGYYNRENQKVRAALLVSPQGEMFVKANPRILNDLDKGLQKLTRGEFAVDL